MKHARSLRVRSAVAVVVAALVIGAIALAGTRGAGSGAGETDAGAAPLPAPSAEATASASPSVPASEARSRIVIQGVGDVSLDPSYLPVFRERGWSWAWSGTGGIFRGDDMTVVNLECPVTPISAPIEKEFNFRCDPAALGAMREAGVEVANQANNHAFDQGPDGLLDSLRWIRAAGLTPVGAGPDAGEAIRPAVFEIGGWRVAVVGMGEVLDPLWQVATPDGPGTAVGHDLEAGLRGIRAASKVADIVVVVIHWGVELDTAPRAYQVEEARQMVAAGADVIFGHHSHRLQPLEVVDGKPVFYGLGNFIWPRFSSDGARTAVARVVVLPDGTLEAELVPFEIVSHGHPVPA